MNVSNLAIVVFSTFFLAACVNEVPPGELGSSVALMKSEQTYNPNATEDNLGYVPTGSGERMQSTLDVYHQQTSSMTQGSTVGADGVMAIQAGTSN